MIVLRISKSSLTLFKRQVWSKLSVWSPLETIRVEPSSEQRAVMLV
jgi:hypothetical protein